jgi:glutathione S-transferase
MILYGSSISPYVRKVLVFAAEKGIDLETKPVGLNSDDPDFLASSPFRKIPALQDGDFRIADSSAIIAYLEALRPDPAFIPAEPKSRARTIWYDEFADTILMGCGRTIFFNRIVAPRFLKRQGDLAAAERAERDELPPILDYLESAVPESGFLVEDRLTLADIAVASPLVNVRHHLGIDIDAGCRPRLAAYLDGILSRPSFTHWIDRETAFFARAA